MCARANQNSLACRVEFDWLSGRVCVCVCCARASRRTSTSVTLLACRAARSLARNAPESPQARNEAAQACKSSGHRVERNCSPFPLCLAEPRLSMTNNNCALPVERSFLMAATRILCSVRLSESGQRIQRSLGLLRWPPVCESDRVRSPKPDRVRSPQPDRVRSSPKPELPNPSLERKQSHSFELASCVISRLAACLPLCGRVETCPAQQSQCAAN